jgi:para-nitrobenzyl esterase
MTRTDEERALTRTVHACWIAFATTGQPHCDGAPAWPRYRGSDDVLMDFGAVAQIRRNFRKSQLDAQESAMGELLAAQRRTLEKLLAGGF